MRYAIIEDGKVINIAVSDVALSDNWIEARDASIGDLWDDTTFTKPTSQLSRDEIVDYVQRRLDTFARTRGYDNIVSACSYATSQHPKYGPEGRYCVEAREMTWDAMFAIEAEVIAGTRSMPTNYAEINVELPVLAWPN